MKTFAQALGSSVGRLIGVICAAVFVTAAHTAQAGINVWTGHGPHGSPGAFVWALAIDPTTPSTLYAGVGHSFGDGSAIGDVYKSTDGASTWSAANAGLGSPVDALAIDPTTPDTLYAATRSSASSPGGVFKSRDGGRTWVAVDAGLPSTEISVVALVIDPSTPSTLYAGTSAGVYKSTDGGSAWSATNAGLPTTKFFVAALAIDPTAPDTLYAGIPPDDDANGVFKSTDGGSTWGRVNTSEVGVVLALAIDPAAPSTLYAATAYAGVLKSTDGGSTWSGGNYGQFMETVLYALAIEPTASGTLYAAGDGMYKSKDGGSTWRAFNAGLPPNVRALAIDPSTPGTLYAGTLGDGVFSIQLGTCIGDCNSDGTVTVDEIVTGVTIAQDFSPLGECPAFDAGAEGGVTIDEIIAGVNNGLNGCPTEGTGCKAVDGNADIDVGGYHLRVNCVGSGEPTIIFDSGTGSGIEAWRAVQPTVGGFTRACAYNRAGYGQSNPGPLPRTSEQIVSELHTLLKNSCLPGPYVLVGHSFGGLNIHLYASTYPQDVAGLVFVDGTPAEFCDRWAASGLADVRPCIRCPIQSGALGSECLNIETSQAQVQSAGPLPDVPTVVFVAGAFQAHSGPPLTGAQSQQRENMWLELQTGLAHSVPDGTLVATDCPHAIQDCRPDLITSVVQTMVETIRIEHSGAPMVAPR